MFVIQNVITITETWEETRRNALFFVCTKIVFFERYVKIELNILNRKNIAAFFPFWCQIYLHGVKKLQRRQEKIVRIQNSFCRGKDDSLKNVTAKIVFYSS